MQVFVEFALLENFCMDFTLLYAAKAAVKNRASFKRIALAAAYGACFAVVFPKFGLGGWWGTAVKFAAALPMCLAAGKFSGFKGYLKFTGVFFALSAVLGGALIGVFSLTGASYLGGDGYLISSVPVGIPLFGALVIVILAHRLAAKFSKGSKNRVKCRIYAGQSHVELGGFFDSGNRVFIHGAPVSVIPKEAAEKLTVQGIKEGIKIHTVAGSEKMEVFTADAVEIDFGGSTRTLKGVKIGISPKRIDCAVLHPDLMEELNV